MKLKARDERFDLAILESDIRPEKELHLGDDSELKQSDNILLLGFPQHHKAADVSLYKGEVVHEFTAEDGARRFHISCSIIQGNSGGPVLNARNQVIGVAIKGGPRELNVVVPISYLLRIASAAK